MDSISNVSTPGHLVVKANQLIEARYKFTLWEMRVFTSMVSLIRPQDKEFNNCKLYIKDLMKFYNSSSKEDYETIRRVPISLSKKQVELMYVGKEGRRWANITLFPTVTRPADDDNSRKNAFIELKFNEELKPLLLELKNKYRIYDINNIVPLRSVYSIRLFELLKQYENTRQKRREFEVSHLKEILGLSETSDDFSERIKRLRGEAKVAAIEKGKIQKYPLYGDFRKRVLLKAQKDLKKCCDISFEFDEVKASKRVVGIVFHIIPNKTEQLASGAVQSKYDKNVTPVKKEKAAASELYMELYPKVRDWIEQKHFEKLLKDYPENQIRNAIQLTLNRIDRGDVIHNIGGHIVSLAKQQVLFASTATTKKQKTKAKKEKLEITASKEEALNQELKELNQAYFQSKRSICDEMIADNNGLLNTLVDQLNDNMIIAGKLQAGQSAEEIYASNISTGIIQTRLQNLYPDAFKVEEQKYSKLIKAVKKKLKAL